MPLVIGLGYQKQQGKDTIATMIHDKCGAVRGRAVSLVSFAAACKRECTQDFEKFVDRQHFGRNFLRRSVTSLSPETYRPILHELWLGWCASRIHKCAPPKDYSIAPVMWDDPHCPYGKCREALQWWGTEYRRAQNEHYWLDRVREFIDKSTVDVVVITDCRFINEAQLVQREYGGEVWEVRRKGMPVSTDTHISETALKGFPFDRVIEAADLRELEAVGLTQFELAWLRHIQPPCSTC